MKIQNKFSRKCLTLKEQSLGSLYSCGEGGASFSIDTDAKKEIGWKGNGKVHIKILINWML